jgi:hypothetical protein
VGAISFLTDRKSIEQSLGILSFKTYSIPKFYLVEGQGTLEIVLEEGLDLSLTMRVVESELKEQSRLALV